MLVLTAALMLFCAFVCKLSFVRLFESIKDLWNSFVFFFNKLVLDKETKITVTAPSSSVSLSVLIPASFAELKLKFIAYGNLLLSGEGLVLYLKFILKFLKFIPLIIMFCMPLVVLFFVFKNLTDKRTNNDYGKESKPLIIFKRLTKMYRPIRSGVFDVINFAKEKRNYIGLWGLLLMVSFNIVTIIIEAVAYYFYVTMSFDFGNIYMQLYKLLVDLALALSYLPAPIWVIAALILFDRFRKNIARQRLTHMEMKNRGFINCLPIANMINGSMGKGKTTVLVDMALSQEVMFRDKQSEMIMQNDLMFPYFPWAVLEAELKKAIEFHQVYNLATAKAFINKIANRFYKKPSIDRLFGYDYNRYGLYFDTKLEHKFLFEVLKNYVQLYFMYVISSPFLVSNLSIREDNVLLSEGNFPLWSNDLLFRDTAFAEGNSKYAHILDFDMLRLGRIVLEDNRNKDAFEFGVVCITEIGKERGNRLENEGKKKTDDSTNQLNDLFNVYIKMCRHSGTVDNFPFVKFFFDEQRASSLGADAKELCTIVNISDKSERKLAMPFFCLSELLYSFIKPRFENYYKDFRYRRGDTTLFSYLCKSLFAKLDSYYKGIYNRFSYFNLKLATESGTLDGNKDINNYYLITKKIYSKRFATDCFSDFFAEKALRSKVGLNDLRMYEDVRPRFDELDYQKSYFIKDITKVKGDKNVNE